MSSQSYVHPASTLVLWCTSGEASQRGCANHVALSVEASFALKSISCTRGWFQCIRYVESGYVIDGAGENFSSFGGTGGGSSSFKSSTSSSIVFFSPPLHVPAVIVINISFVCTRAPLLVFLGVRSVLLGPRFNASLVRSRCAREKSGRSVGSDAQRMPTLTSITDQTLMAIES